jgi:hypothetical protein
VLVYGSILWLSTESGLYVIFMSLILVFVYYPHQLLVLCRPMMHPRQHISSQPRAAADIFSNLLPAAGEGSGDVAAAGLAMASSVTVLGSAGLCLQLAPRNCATTMVVATATSLLVSYLGSFLPLLHTLAP